MKAKMKTSDYFHNFYFFPVLVILLEDALNTEKKSLSFFQEQKPWRAFENVLSL
jgi:hypothetical protein